MRHYRFSFILVLMIIPGLLMITQSSLATTPTPTPEPEISATSEGVAIEVMIPEVIERRPHDTDSYTQGLLLFEGELYESAGQYGESDVRRVDAETGEVLQKVELDAAYFAEGLALVDERLIQITWKEERAFVYDRETFEVIDEYAYEGEGWGLCYDGTALWMSDGSATLVTRDPESFEIVGSRAVTLQGMALDQFVTATGRSMSALNELECVGDTIYANVYLTDYILRIDSSSGVVTGVINASDLLEADEQAALGSGEVLNGIAYDAEAETFLITGKRWPALFEVRWQVVNVVP